MEQLKLKPNVKAEWVAALKSGEYLQTYGRLRDSNGFCCLGVLCDLYSRETGDGGWVDKSAEYDEDEDGDEVYPNSSEYYYMNNDTEPSNEVLRWAFENYVSREDNLNDYHAKDVVVAAPRGNSIHGDIFPYSLAEHNDCEASFETIAAIIDENL